MQILYCVTGSDGNCTVIESESGKLLTIDCGIQYNKVNRAIGYRLHECKELLITHAHNDHSKFRQDFTKRGMKLYAPIENASESEKTASYDLSGFRVLAFPLKHSNSDGSECPCYGFLIQDKASGEKMLWATDTQYIPYRFPALEIYALEANFWEQEDYLDELDAIEAVVEKRRVRAHMSIETAVDFLKKQDLSKCKEIRLLHMSNSVTKEEKERIIPYIQEQLGRKDLTIIHE